MRYDNGIIWCIISKAAQDKYAFLLKLSPPMVETKCHGKQDRVTRIKTKQKSKKNTRNWLKWTLFDIDATIVLIKVYISGNNYIFHFQIKCYFASNMTGSVFDIILTVRFGICQGCPIWDLFCIGIACVRYDDVIIWFIISKAAQDEYFFLKNLHQQCPRPNVWNQDAYQNQKSPIRTLVIG